MVTLAAGEVVLVLFPFSDLSQSKVRPAVCLADAGRGDRVLCQITSNPYGDPDRYAFGGCRFQLGRVAC
jgi:mRNA interferase MazF